MTSSYAMIAFAGAHFVVLVVYIILLASKGAVWHWSYTETVPSVNEQYSYFAGSHGDGSTVVEYGRAFKKRTYDRVIAREHSAAVCNPTSLTAPLETSEAWNTMLYSREHDMCLFKQVTHVMDRPSDPRDLSVFASGSPFFLLATMQVLVFSHLHWSASPLTQFGISGWVDLVIACALPLVWLVISFALQMELTVVYNNMLLVVLTTSLVVALEVVWTMQSAAARGVPNDTTEADEEAEVVDIKKTETVPDNALVPYVPQQKPQQNVPGSVPVFVVFPVPQDQPPSQSTRRNGMQTIADRINVSTLLSRPTTRVPLMPMDEQGDVYKAWNTVNHVTDKLAKHNLLAVPRLMLLPIVLAMVATAALFAAGSFWRYAEVAMFVLIMVMVTAMNVPLFVVARVAALNTSAEKVGNRVICGWIFVCIIGILVALFPVLVCVHMLVLLPVVAELSAVRLVAAVAMYSVLAAVTGCICILAHVPMSVVSWEVEIRTVLMSVLGLLVFVL